MPANTRLRERVLARFVGTQPGGDPFSHLRTLLTPEQMAAARRHLPTELRHAAVLVPLIDRPEGLTVLLTLRASHLKHHAGQISFPGGRTEAHDASPLETALRETEEEIGLAREFVSHVGYLNDHAVVTGFRITPAVALVRPGFTLTLDRTEVEEVFEMPLEFILDPQHHVPRDRDFKGVTVITYEIPFEGRHIWGATAQMLVNLARLLAEP
ncbi:MAG TPA: CoA pyrophosphatase [Steroidobacteraceae bacterium]|nr:CoA pyrophosphatase [Steroidobacteraceae bacterium]